MNQEEIKKKDEIRTVKVEGRKITDQQIITEILMSILLLSQKILKDKVK